MELDRDLERRLATGLFNHVWELLEAPDRSQSDDDDMIHSAHASRHHWGRVGEGVHRARGEWQISRVYSVLRRAEAARAHAKRYQQLCEEHDLAAFDRGFAHEALGRAAAVAGEKAEARRQVALGRSAAAAVDKSDDREWLIENLEEVERLAQ